VDAKGVKTVWWMCAANKNHKKNARAKSKRGNGYGSSGRQRQGGRRDDDWAAH
jgi:hypothetical protein